MADQLTRCRRPTLIHLVCSSGFYGAERVIANLCQVLPELNTIVVCLSPVPERVQGFADKVRSTGAEFICVDNRFTQAFRTLQRIQQQQGPVVLHAHGYKEIVIACGFALFSNSRVVVTQHGFTRRNVKSRIYNWIDKVFCRWGNVDRVIAVSQTILEEYRAFAVNPVKMRLVPNAVSVSNGPAERVLARTTLKQRYSISETTPLVLFAGRLSQEKDPLLFVESMALLLHSLPDAKGLIAGDGPLKDPVLQRIDELGISACVHWLGFVEQLDQLLPAADLLMLTSETEGTPMSVLEAMASGVAVIASRVGGLPSLIEDQVDGMLISPRTADAFAGAAQGLLENDIRRVGMTQRANRKIVRQYDLKQQSRIYLRDIYAVEALS